jgi:hypothetical protein
VEDFGTGKSSRDVIESARTVPTETPHLTRSARAADKFRRGAHFAVLNVFREQVDLSMIEPDDCLDTTHAHLAVPDETESVVSERFFGGINKPRSDQTACEPGHATRVDLAEEIGRSVDRACGPGRDLDTRLLGPTIVPMWTKKHAGHVAGVAASVIVYGSAPIAERAKAAEETLTPADASHRKSDADTRHDEGERGEFPTDGMRILLTIGATAGSEASSSSADMVVSRVG